MSEKWEEIYTKEQIKKIQQIEIKNLIELKRVCEEIGVEFFLYGGSLIGAVRHKGFVPWDDDLDVAMSRDDYEKFIREAPKKLSPEYFLQSPLNDKKSPYIYTKLRLKGTKYAEYGHHLIKMEKGIYIDIYPIDRLPENDEEFLRLYNKFQSIVRLYVLRQSPYPYIKQRSFVRNFKDAVRFVASYVLRIVPRKVYLKRIYDIMTFYNDKNSSRYGNYSYFDPVNLFKDIHPFEKGEFEGIEVNLPNEWDYHLNKRYGDYMKMPPEEERIGHKPYILDFGKY